MSADLASAEAGMGAIPEQVAAVRKTYDSGRTRELAWRRGQLQAMLRLLSEREEELAAALHADLGKNALESYLTEVSITRSEVEYTLKHLAAWTRSRKVPVPLGLQPASARTEPQPLGVVLIISPWNYPVQLLLAPLIGALAAGNAAVLKPSELAPATSAALARILPHYLDPEAVVVIEGAQEESEALLKERFDHIFFTGGERVGKAVMRAAAEHLTPVTLELGGKSPAVVLDGNLAAVARRLVYGKLMNAGQTCVAPDYVLATGDVAPKLVAALGKAIREFVGKDPSRSPDFGRIINERHFDRLTAYLSDGTVASGGRSDRQALYLEPTVLTGVALESPVMQEEIFGPILPVITVPDLDAAMDIINSRPSPLASYLFTSSAANQRKFEQGVRAGSVNHNAAIVQLAVPELPFGGAGASGMGAYHGKHSFDTFSQLRPVFSKGTLLDTLRVAYPPYNGFKSRILRRLL
ncbi:MULTISPECIES: aldehyde dehydrogenase family protein [Arthrobacter]|uniref:Aldehyde dehydrogenase n=1 Tax=Arthrobacter caoxuetaonis TaxID=2886935 RepID=A0A9X1MFE2_9MICC|nr:aldehyde dehydrogenase family protein [Arthrobacter caoxuetaonis]MCC3281709.1 aldehyde dehydrogenase family protein [Arthrobacter caoxuetaonis]MCC3298621.1 aldehyde dehydrogenase family protein [Arthrobacter caoxuetaonis]MCC9194848.1 aldehyde dehydrogenase family protein [Arthrobacter sp. zg-Y916]USQ57362.1 aldehyde dehydrogenase family protein [Arthrobacter caoxuetaonis]